MYGWLCVLIGLFVVIYDGSVGCCLLICFVYVQCDLCSTVGVLCYFWGGGGQRATSCLVCMVVWCLRLCSYGFVV